MEELTNDYQVEGQLSIYDVFYPEMQNNNTLVAVSKIFARAIKQMSVNEWKTFIYALTFLKFNEKNGNVIYLDKGVLANLIGIKADSDHLSQDLKRSVGRLPKNSEIIIDREDKDYFESGMFINRIVMHKNIVKVVFNPDYMPLFEELNSDKPYVTMWAADLFKMNTERSILFYEDLRLHSDTRKSNERIYGIRDLKQMFNIPKDGRGSYMRKDGHFNRTEFEKKVIQPLCDDLSTCEMIKLHLNPDRKYWEKIKNNHGNVVGYKFTWSVSTHPNVATAKELKEIKDRIEENPQVLKIAKDIIKGEKAPKKKKNSFDNFKSRNYDYDALEAEISENKPNN